MTFFYISYRKKPVTLAIWKLLEFYFRNYCGVFSQFYVNFYIKVKTSWHIDFYIKTTRKMVFLQKQQKTRAVCIENGEVCSLSCNLSFRKIRIYFSYLLEFCYNYCYVLLNLLCSRIFKRIFCVIIRFLPNKPSNEDDFWE